MIAKMKRMARYLCSARMEGALYSNCGFGTKLSGPLPPAGPSVGSRTSRASRFARSEAALKYVSLKAPLT